MILNTINISMFRNISRAELSFGSSFNIFHGGNGQGKTNFLEAIFFMGTLKSFRHAKQAEMIKWDQESSSLKCSVIDNNLKHELALSFYGNGKHISIDGKTASRVVDFCTILAVVAFSPEELTMVSGTPEQRRRYLDRAIFSSNPGYLKIYHDYFRVLKQRNRLLRLQNYSGLEAWTDQLVTLGARLISTRNAYVTELSELFEHYYKSISGSDEVGHLCYHANSLDEMSDTVQIGSELHTKITNSRKLERERGTTMIGPHRDDLGFFLNGKPIRQHGSQGQQKSFVLALKMAEIEYLYKNNGVVPILLLDDMTAELDNSRINHLMDFLVEKKLQVFITTTDPATIPLPETISRTLFRIREGRSEQ